MSICRPYCGAQNWTQHSRSSFASAEQRGKITSLDVLAMLLMHPRSLFAFSVARTSCCSCPIWCPPGLLRPVMSNCFPAGQLVRGVSLTRDRTLLSFMMVLSFLQPDKAPLDSSVLLQCAIHSFQLGITCKLGEGALCPSIQIIKTLKTTGPVLIPGVAHWRVASSWTLYPASQPSKTSCSASSQPLSLLFI